MPAELKASEVIVGGVRTRVRQAGDTSSPEAVVFVHGNPGPSDDWEFVAPDVGDFARAVMLDMPGYGLAERPRDFDYTIEGYARFLDGVLDQLGIRDVHLVLHDFGGGWGLSWAADHLERVRSVTFIDCGVLLDYEWHTFAKLWQTPIVGELVQLASNAWGMRRTLDRVNPKPMPPEFVDRVMRYADWGHKRAVLKLYRNSKNMVARAREIVERTGPIDLPVLVLWGEGDTFLPATHAERQKQFFPRAEVHVLPGCGHWPFIDDPETVRALMLQFLRANVGKVKRRDGQEDAFVATRSSKS